MSLELFLVVWSIASGGCADMTQRYDEAVAKGEVPFYMQMQDLPELNCLNNRQRLRRFSVTAGVDLCSEVR
jgi:hypothetical protein